MSHAIRATRVVVLPLPAGATHSTGPGRCGRGGPLVDHRSSESGRHVGCTGTGSGSRPPPRLSATCRRDRPDNQAAHRRLQPVHDAAEAPHVDRQHRTGTDGGAATAPNRPNRVIGERDPRVDDVPTAGEAARRPAAGANTRPPPWIVDPSAERPCWPRPASWPWPGWRTPIRSRVDGRPGDDRHREASSACPVGPSATVTVDVAFAVTCVRDQPCRRGPDRHASAQAGAHMARRGRPRACPTPTSARCRATGRPTA